jgi:hypothetical protein
VVKNLKLDFFGVTSGEDADFAVDFFATNILEMVYVPPAGKKALEKSIDDTK